MSSFSSYELLQEILTVVPNEDGANEFLDSFDWPLGLKQEYFRNIKKIPIRFIVYDDSGSVSFRSNYLTSFSSMMSSIFRWAPPMVISWLGNEAIPSNCTFSLGVVWSIIIEYL